LLAITVIRVDCADNPVFATHIEASIICSFSS
jgi:hypothetical protein